MRSALCAWKRSNLLTISFCSVSGRGEFGNLASVGGAATVVFRHPWLSGGRNGLPFVLVRNLPELGIQCSVLLFGRFGRSATI